MRRRVTRALIALVAVAVVLWIGYAACWAFSGGLFGHQAPSWGLFREGLRMGPEFAGMILSAGWDRVFPPGDSHKEAGSGCGASQFLLPLLPSGREPALEVRERAGHVYFGWTARAGEVFAYEVGVPGARTSKGDWDRATPVDRREVFSEGARGERSFLFHGRGYWPSGARWFGDRPKAALSPDGGMLATATFDGPIWPSVLFFWSPSRRWWNLHLEAFDVATGRTLLHQVGGHMRLPGPPRDPHPIWGASGVLLADGGTEPFTVMVCPVSGNPEASRL